MNIYSEIKKIAMANDKITRLTNSLKEKIDCDGLDFRDAYFIRGCSEKGGHLYQDGGRLDNSGIVDNDYYCHQITGYLGDDFYGTVFFKTNVPGEFVAVPFSM